MWRRRAAEEALAINVTAARALQELLKSSLGPRGTVKMLVSEAGEVRMTKSGGALLREMRLQHPTASLVAQAAVTMGDTAGDGVISVVLLVGEMLRRAEILVSEGVHPRLIVEGLEAAKEEAIGCLDELWEDQEDSIMRKVARTSLGTKLCPMLAEGLTQLVVEAVMAISHRREPVDLRLVGLVEMSQGMELDTTLVKGLVLEHGARHPGMRRRVEDAFILGLNMALELGRPRDNASCFHKDVEDRESFTKAERRTAQEKVDKILALKREVCGHSGKGFVVVNQKGIDPLALEELAREGVVALRRTKRSDMERLPLACGGQTVSSVVELTTEILGQAGLVHQQTMGERTYTFIEGCHNPRSVTVVIRGPNQHVTGQLREAVRCGMLAVKNTFEDGCAMPGAGAVEIRIGNWLANHAQPKVKGAARLGFRAFADAILVIPKTLAQNAGYHPQETVGKALEAEERTTLPVGIDLSTGGLVEGWETPVWDNATVKHQLIHTSTAIVRNILLVDNIVTTGATKSPKSHI
ncbi:T-complex protein 1 subunit zeta-like [Leucoraja erinacea]|uniref:T-complex protein 1 subunit zeta-like n=1 Tax=Leucoraja erinaceus TaxID=7782 RepID=UPI0024577A6E|nr:T-complex protein 1 subunit zeta-like [Leucoraja erinacea]XP_055490358.1 T-complex protein 1 subunit zeta-like [Leucoraja erinacea]